MAILMACSILLSDCCQLLPGQAYLNAKVLLKCCSELLTQWYVYFLCRFERSVSIHSPTGFTF